MIINNFNKNTLKKKNSIKKKKKIKNITLKLTQYKKNWIVEYQKLNKKKLILS